MKIYSINNIYNNRNYNINKTNNRNNLDSTVQHTNNVTFNGIKKAKSYAAMLGLMFSISYGMFAKSPSLQNMIPYTAIGATIGSLIGISEDDDDDENYDNSRRAI